MIEKLRSASIPNWKYYLGFVLLLALVSRFIQIDFQSLWLDEIYTMNMADPRNSVAEIYRLSHVKDGLSVLYFILLNTCFKIFGYTSFVARAFSALFGIAGIYSIYLLGKELKSRSAGLIAAVLLCVNTFHLCYSQEARVYTMYLAFTCFSFYYLVKLIRVPAVKNGLLYGLFALLTLMAHFYGMFVLVAQAIAVLTYILATRKANWKKLIYCSLLAALVVVVGYVPIIPILLIVAKTSTTWLPPVTSNAFAELYNSFFGNSFLVVSTSVVMILFYFFSVFNDAPETEVGETEHSSNNSLRPAFYLLIIWILVNFMIPYIRSFIALPMIYGRYMITLVPAFVLLMAFGIDLVKSRGLKLSLLGIFASVSVLEITIVNEYYNKITKSDFRGVCRFVTYNNGPQSKISTRLSYHFDYYFRVYNNKAPLIERHPNDLVTDMRLGRQKDEPFWVVDAHSLVFDLTEENYRYLYENFEEVRKMDSRDAWAKYYIPREKIDSSRLVMKLDARNFYDTLPYEYDNNLYLNRNGAIESRGFALDSGQYSLVIKGMGLPANPINGVYPHLNVYWANKKIGDYHFSRKSFIEGDTVLMRLSGEVHAKLKLEFDNDTTAGDLDRNILLREIMLLRRP